MHWPAEASTKTSITVPVRRHQTRLFDGSPAGAGPELQRGVTGPAGEPGPGGDAVVGDHLQDGTSGGRRAGSSAEHEPVRTHRSPEANQATVLRPADGGEIRGREQAFASVARRPTEGIARFSMTSAWHLMRRVRGQGRARPRLETEHQLTATAELQQPGQSKPGTCTGAGAGRDELLAAAGWSELVGRVY